MGQTVAAKEGHERLGKRGESFIKGQQGGFAGKGIADQDGNKIDHVVLTKACAGEAHLFLDDFEDSLMGKNLSKGSHFSHPGRSRGLRFRGNLDRDRRMRHTTNVSSLFEKRSLIVFSQGDTFFARAPASLLFSYETSLRIPWDFKRDAIRYAWELLTQELQLPIERLWITIHRDDDEAARLWEEIGVEPQRILRF